MQEDYQNIENKNNNPPNPPYQGGGQQPTPLGKGQKVAVAVLAIFAIFAVVMWSRQFKKSINGPFAYNEAQTQNLGSTQGENSDEDLKNKDTDLDGLSDFDELNLYKTSPYLEDSDSDGFSDKNEIDSENDPNCPTGRDCYASADLPEENSEEENLKQNNLNSGSLNSLLNQSGTLPSEGSAGQVAGQVDMEKILGGELNAQSLRQLLIEAGMDKSILDKISDDDLLKSYQETLKK